MTFLKKGFIAVTAASTVSGGARWFDKRFMYEKFFQMPFMSGLVSFDDEARAESEQQLPTLNNM